METNRRKTLGVLGFAAVSAAALPASAARGLWAKPGAQPEIINPGRGPWQPQGGAWAYVRCAVPVVSVTCRLYNGDHTVELGRYELSLTNGHALEGVWIGPPLTRVALGNHRVVYDATSADGGVASVTANFSLWLTPIFTGSVQPNPIDEDHRVVTISGTVMGEHPVSHAITPIGGLGLKAFAWYVRIPPGGPQFSEAFLTTAPDGSYSTQMTLALPGTVSVSTEDLPQNSLVGSGGTGNMTVSVAEWQTRLSLQLGSTVVDPGQATTAEGKLEVLRAGQWRPLAGRSVGLTLIEEATGNPDAGPSPVTDGLGRFRVDVAPRSTGHYLATFNRIPLPDLFYDEASATSARITVRTPARFSDDLFIVRAAPTATEPRRYEATGRIYTLENSPRIQLQYRPRQATEWRTLTTVVPDRVANDGGKMFTGRFTMPGSGQIRAYVERSNLTLEAATKMVTIIFPRRPAPTRPEGGRVTDPRRLPPPRRT